MVSTVLRRSSPPTVGLMPASSSLLIKSLSFVFSGIATAPSRSRTSIFTVSARFRWAGNISSGASFMKFRTYLLYIRLDVAGM